MADGVSLASSGAGGGTVQAAEAEAGGPLASRLAQLSFSSTASSSPPSSSDLQSPRVAKPRPACSCATTRAACANQVCCLDFFGERAPEGDEVAPDDASVAPRCQRLACDLVRAQARDMADRQAERHRFDPAAAFAPYRSLVVQWMLDVGLGLELSSLTVHSAVSLLDYTLTTRPVPRGQLQLVALCCMLLASKVEENYARVPSIGQLNHCANDVFTEDEVVRMERAVLDSLEWRLSAVTASHFAGVLRRRGLVCACDRVRSPATGPGASYFACTGRVHQYVGKYVQFFLDFAAREHSLQRFLPSLLAAAVVAASRTVCGLRPVWTRRLERASRHTAEQVDACWRELLGLYRGEYPEESRHHLSAADVVRLRLRDTEDDDEEAGSAAAAAAAWEST